MGDYAELRAALEAGPTRGKWIAHVMAREVEVTAPCGRTIYVAGANSDAESVPDARYIAAANPETIRTLLDDLDARAAEIERLLAEVAELAALRARYEAAPTGTITNTRSNGVPNSIAIHGELPSDSWGKRVRLVVEGEG